MRTATDREPTHPVLLPLELPRLVMTRALMVAPLALLLAMLIGFLRSGDDIRSETEGALALATTLMQVNDAAQLDEAAARRALQSLQMDERLRHVTLDLRDSDGRLLLASTPPPPPQAPLSWLVALHRLWQRDAPPLQLNHSVVRPDGRAWQLTLSTLSDSERLDGMRYLLEELLADSISVGVMLLVMSISLRGVFRPLQALLGAIGRIQRNEPRAAESLPTMAVGELRQVVNALRQLHEAWQQEEERRRLLSHQLQTLQEDERQRLARELHDEFGQRLTALRVDAAWLQQRHAQDPEVFRVAEGMVAQCARLQLDIRHTLARLQPLGPAEQQAQPGASRLAELLQALARGWDHSPTVALKVRLVLKWQEREGQVGPWPDPHHDLPMPRELLLSIYRMSQEALTNVARHAQAQNVELRLTLRQDDARVVLHWSVTDDGVGMPDLQAAQQRGSGLAGLKERAWAQGADLASGPVHPDRPRPGLRLQADFAWMIPPVAGSTKDGDEG